IPAAAALRRAWPDARIDWLVSARHAAILELVAGIDRRILINDRGGARTGLSVPAALRELRRGQYDVALDLQGLVKSALLARASGAARVAGFAAPYARERLAALLYTHTYTPGAGGMRDPREPRHVVTLNLGLLTIVGITAAAV